MSKRVIVMLLIGVNAVLLTILTLTAARLPEARAQAAPLASNYLMVAGEINSDHDALYILDLPTRAMHVFEMDRTTRKLIHLDARDLKLDFREGR